jgi:hypothetical protein
MASNIHRVFLLAALAAMAPGMAQERLDPATSIKFDLPADAPLRVESFDPAESRVSSRSGALVIDLHLVAKLRNTSGDYIRSITLRLLAQESPAGGRTSKSFPIVNAAPNEVFTVPIDGRLMRPVQPGVQPAGPLVRIIVDGVLFRNYEFYGPDRLNSHRQMLAWAMQSDRDRKYYKQVLQTRGVAGLQQEMLDSITRQSERPHLDVQLAARGRSTTSAASAPDHVAQFAFLQIPESPIRPTSGWAEIDGNEARYPKIEIQNTSSKHIRYVEIGWLIKDTQGTEYLAGSVTPAEGELYLPPGRTARLLPDTSLRFSRKGGQAVNVQNMTGFVSEVEYSDGNIWIPKREDLKRSDLLRVMPPSFEEQHLTDLYRQNIDVLVRELNKF